MVNSFYRQGNLMYYRSIICIVVHSYCAISNPFYAVRVLALGDKLIINSVYVMLWYVEIIMYGVKTFTYCDENVSRNGQSLSLYDVTILSNALV